GAGAGRRGGLRRGGAARMPAATRRLPSSVQRARASSSAAPWAGASASQSASVFRSPLLKGRRPARRTAHSAALASMSRRRRLDEFKNASHSECADRDRSRKETREPCGSGGGGG